MNCLAGSWKFMEGLVAWVPIYHGFEFQDMDSWLDSRLDIDSLNDAQSKDLLGS